MNHGQIGFRIDHTARTWGADLESLLTGHAQTLLKEETGLRRFVSNHSGKVGAIVGGSLGLAILAGTFVLSHRFASYQLAQARTALQTGNAASKINFLIENAARGEWIQFGNVLVFIIIGGCLAALGLAAWASSAAELPPLAFVLLTKRAEERRILRLASRRRRWASFVLSIILSIIASVLANILFAWAF